MIIENVQITVSTPLFDFENYSHTEKIFEPEVKEEQSSEVSFLEATCIGNNLIVLAEQD